MSEPHTRLYLITISNTLENFISVNSAAFSFKIQYWNTENSLLQCDGMFFIYFFFYLQKVNTLVTFSGVKISYSIEYMIQYNHFECHIHIINQ